MPISKLLQPKFLLILICVFFLITRLYKISEIPTSLYWDEASIGYNAYSILTTGKDEWGESFPLHFRSFGEFKLPVYIYAVVPSILAFGLNEFSVRFPAVLFSLGVVLLTYLLAKRLTGSRAVGLLAAFFASITPWFFIFSRTGYEATAGLMFYLLGVYVFLRTDKKGWNVLISLFCFILSAYSYNSFRVIIPPAVTILIVYYFNNLKSSFRKEILPVAFAVIILILSIIPIYKLYVYDSGASRLKAVSAPKTEFVKNYLSHFNLDFLLFNGDKNLRSQQAGFGQLSLPLLFFLVIGIIFAVKSKSKNNYLPLVLLLLSPIPAALTKESPHSLRMISAVPFIAILGSIGVNVVAHNRLIARKANLVYLVIIIIFLFFFINYFFRFLNNYPIQSAKDWQYGYKEIFTKFEKDFSKYNRVIISDEYAQPYIFALFYLQYDPVRFTSNAVRNNVSNWGFSTVNKFDKLEFGKVDKLLEKDPRNTLIFASSDEIIADLNLLETIKFPDGEIAFWVYKL